MATLCCYLEGDCKRLKPVTEVDARARNEFRGYIVVRLYQVVPYAFEKFKKKILAAHDLAAHSDIDTAIPRRLNLG